MSSIEIRNRIDELNEKISNIMIPGAFVLQEEVVAMFREIDSLQSQCGHSFAENGICEYCYKEKN